MKEVLEFLQKAGTFYLATMDGDQPRVRPFGAVCEFENKLYLITNNKKDVYRQLADNPKLEISAAIDGQWIRLSAEAVFDVRREPKTAMLNACPELRGMYSEDDGVMEVLYLKNAEAKLCSFTAAPVTYKF